MASQSHRSIVSVFAMCAGLGLKICEQRPNNAILRKLCAALQAATDAAFLLYPHTFTIREIEQIGIELQIYESHVLTRQWRLAMLTSMLMGILNDLIEPLYDGAKPIITHPVKVAAIRRVLDCLEAIHDYHDRTHDKWPVYMEANKAADYWLERRAA